MLLCQAWCQELGDSGHITTMNIVLHKSIMTSPSHQGTIQNIKPKKVKSWCWNRIEHLSTSNVPSSTSHIQTLVTKNYESGKLNHLSYHLTNRLQIQFKEHGETRDLVGVQWQWEDWFTLHTDWTRWTHPLSFLSPPIPASSAPGNQATLASSDSDGRSELIKGDDRQPGTLLSSFSFAQSL